MVHPAEDVGLCQKPRFWAVWRKVVDVVVYPAADVGVCKRQT